MTELKGALHRIKSALEEALDYSVGESYRKIDQALSDIDLILKAVPVGLDASCVFTEDIPRLKTGHERSVIKAAQLLANIVEKT